MMAATVLGLSLWMPYCLAMRVMPSMPADAQCAQTMGGQSGMNQHCAQLQAAAGYLDSRAVPANSPHWQPLVVSVSLAPAPAYRTQVTPDFSFSRSPPRSVPLNLRYCVFLK